MTAPTRSFLENIARLTALIVAVPIGFVVFALIGLVVTDTIAAAVLALLDPWPHLVH